MRLSRGLSSGLLFFRFFLSSFRLACLFLLFLLLELRAEQLEDRQLRAVADAEAGMDDARVAAGAVGKARSDVGEELLGGHRRHKVRRRLSARLQRIPLAEGDHIL